MREPPAFRTLYALVRPHMGAIFVAGGIVTAEAAVGLLTPRVTGFAVDAVVKPETASAGRAALATWVIILCGLLVGRAIFYFAQSYLVGSRGARMLHDLRATTYSHLVGLSPAFFEKRRLGELLSRLNADLQHVQNTLTSQIPAGIRAVVMFVGTLIILSTIHLRLTVLALVVVPPIALLALWYGKRLEKLTKQVQDALADSSATAEEALAGIQTVQAFSAEDAERTRYRARLGHMLGLQEREARVVSLFGATMIIVGYSAFAGILWYGGSLILDKKLSPGELTAFLLYAISIASAVSSLGSLYGNFRQLKGASKRVLEILATAPAHQERRGAKSLAAPIESLALRGVSFRYPTAATDALSAIDLEVSRGDTIAVVGPSGAGKSTLFSLLLRFRAPTAGSILLNNVPLDELAVSATRRLIFPVPQDIFLFHGTVADNIRYGVPDSSLDDVRRAAQLAYAHEFIESLPSGYDSLLGARGVNLSTGQRQRIAIARAFLCNPEVLLLDEPTSALDPDSEHHIQEALSHLMHGRTTFVIAHRLATARNADRIIVLNQGRIEHTGSHDELIHLSELYRRYWSRQQDAEKKAS